MQFQKPSTPASCCSYLFTRVLQGRSFLRCALRSLAVRLTPVKIHPFGCTRWPAVNLGCVSGVHRLPFVSARLQRYVLRKVEVILFAVRFLRLPQLVQIRSSNFPRVRRSEEVPAQRGPVVSLRSRVHALQRRTPIRKTHVRHFAA